MGRHFAMWSCCCLLQTLLALVVPAAAGEPEWLEVRSPHFSVVTDAGEKRGREAALRFEQMRAVFGALLTKAKVTIPVPLQIVAFRNTKEMRQFVPLWKGKPTQVAGLFEGNQDRSFILLDMSVEDPWQVVFHEYAHQLLNGNTSAQVQPWFDEGFAEFFSTIKVNGKEADVGLVSNNDFLVLQQTGMMKIADLFRVRQNSSVYNESGDHRSVFYAESWLVVHYIYDKQWVPKLGPYFDLALDRGMPVEEAIQQAFGLSAADLDKALRQYFSRHQFLYYPIPAPAGIESSGYTVKPLAMPDAKAVLADMHLHSPDYQEKAVTEFEDVLKLQPENPAALRGLGYAYLVKQDFRTAGEYFKKATEHDSKDPRALYYSALLAQREGKLGGRDRERLAVIKKQLENSIALDPEFADAYSLLAFTYMSLGEPDRALQTMSKAVALNPRNEGYFFNLAEIYLMNHMYDEAIALLERLQKSSNPGIVAQAGPALAIARDAKLAAAAGVPVHIRSASGRQVEEEVGSGPPGSPVAAGNKVVSSKPPEESAPAENEAPKSVGPPKFLKGRLVAVDCPTAPGAVLTVISGAKTWKLHVRDSVHVIVIGADKFSCGWTNQRVAINYRESGEASGEIISVEIQ